MTKNLEFYDAHADDLKAIAVAGIDDSSRSSMIGSSCTNPERIDQMRIFQLAAWELLVGGGLMVGRLIAQQEVPLPAPVLRPETAPLVFRDVTVIDVRDGTRRTHQTIVVAGRRITAIRSTGASVPVGARVIDARGRYVIPGLWDMHVHPMEYVDIAYPLFVANGVTGVRDAGSNVP